VCANTKILRVLPSPTINITIEYDLEVQL